MLDGLLQTLDSDEISNEMALVWFLERLVLDDGQEGVIARASSAHFALAKNLTRSLSLPVQTHAENLLKVMNNLSNFKKKKSEIPLLEPRKEGGNPSKQSNSHNQDDDTATTVSIFTPS